MFKPGLTLLFFAGLASSVLGQQDYQPSKIAGKWNMCYLRTLDEPCSKVTVQYQFSENGRFTLNDVKVDYADSVVFYGNWTLHNDVLLLKTDSIGLVHRIGRIFFVNKSRFYTMEEPLPGWVLLTVFQKVE